MRPPGTPAALLLRVSSEKQRDRDTIASQEPAGRALCERYGWPVVAVYTEDGVSAKTGRLARRADLLSALDDARRGRFGVQRAGVHFFYKQQIDARGRKLSLPVLDGRQWAEMPGSGRP